MFRRFSFLGAFAIVLLAAAQASAGVVLTVDIGDDGVIEATFTNPADPLPDGLFSPGPAVLNGLTVLVNASLTQAQSGTIFSTNEIGFSGGTAETVVRILTTFTELDLPLGDPLNLVSEVSGTSVYQTASNTSTLIGAPAGVAISNIVGPGAQSNEVLTAGIPRGGSEYGLIQDVLITFLPGSIDFVITATTSVVAPVPEAASIAAWGMCIGMGLFMTFRRRRSA
jgi:hypothetical protein